jgi:hypothetical protein
MAEDMIASTQRATEHPGSAKLHVTLPVAATDPEGPAHDRFTERYRKSAPETTRAPGTARRNGVIRDDEPIGYPGRAMPYTALARSLLHISS